MMANKNLVGGAGAVRVSGGGVAIALGGGLVSAVMVTP
jgi:hypothetical protein